MTFFNLAVANARDQFPTSAALEAAMTEEERKDAVIRANNERIVTAEIQAFLDRQERRKSAR